MFNSFCNKNYTMLIKNVNTVINDAIIRTFNDH